MSPGSDIEYHPVRADVGELIEMIEPDRLLVIGDGVPEAMTLAGSTRLLVSVESDLPTGTYVFRTGDTAYVMHVAEGAVPGAPASIAWSEPDHPLAQAFGWFSHWWARGSPVPLPRFALEDEIQLVPSGQEGRIRTRKFSVDGWFYGVRVGGKSQQVREQSLQVLVIDDDPHQWISREPATANRFAATLTRAKLSEQLTDTVFSFRASRTLFRPYQFRPVIRLLTTGQLRLLIADEVGLGKTIEAGLVWTEFDARSMANRVLVVCPSALVAKWRMEMQERFGFELVDLRSEQLGNLLEQVEEERLPTRLHAVCSLERLRTWDGLQRLAELQPHFDLVIVDEAHAFRNSETRSYALGSLLADWSDALVFLSATPLNLGNDDLFNLLQLLAPGDFSDRAQLEDLLRPNSVLNRVAASLLDSTVSNATRKEWLSEIGAMTFGPGVTARPEFSELQVLLDEVGLTPASVTEARSLIGHLHALSAVVTRTRKAEIQEQKAVRTVATIDVDWTPEEAAFYKGFEDWQVERAKNSGYPIGFVTQMPLRLASSCLPMARQRVMDGSGGVLMDDLDADDDTGPETPELDVPPSSLVDLARELGAVDTKFDAFLPRLRDVVEQGKRVLVFTFSRATLAYLQRRLGDEFRVAVLHGGVTGEDRQAVMQRFRAGDHDVVLASRVASEGLDFEFCSAIVNYDLPWNPMEVEQRIGRIDRFGQLEKRVMIYNFSMPGTIETDMVGRLMSRIGVFEDSIGELEPIIESNLTEIRKALDFTLSPEERRRETDRLLAVIEEQRQAVSEVENATAFLSSTDKTEIEGLEQDLLSSGRYVGQPELRLLIEDWSHVSPGSMYSDSANGSQFILRGTELMERHLRSVRGKGERSEAEIERLAQKLRDEQDIVLYLDQEAARISGGDLLAANHPLVRAALAVPGHTQARFASIRIGPSGRAARSFLVLLAVARWDGLRKSAELWTESVPLDGGEPVDGIGDALLAGLAESELSEGGRLDPDLDMDVFLSRVEAQMMDRQTREELRREAENEALFETRRISLKETHLRKVQRIEGTIDTLRSTGKSNMIRLQEAQLRNQDRLVRAKEAELEQKSTGSLSVEMLAVCVLETEV